MAALYLDEDVPISLADLLRARGHSASTTRAEHRLGSSDPEQLLFAASRGLTLISHNRGDFARLHEAWQLWAQAWEVNRPHAGIIVMRRVLGKPAEDYADLLVDFLDDPQMVLADQFHRWHPHTDWTQTP